MQCHCSCDHSSIHGVVILSVVHVEVVLALKTMNSLHILCQESCLINDYHGPGAPIPHNLAGTPLQVEALLAPLDLLAAADLTLQGYPAVVPGQRAALYGQLPV